MPKSGFNLRRFSVKLPDTLNDRSYVDLAVLTLVAVGATVLRSYYFPTVFREADIVLIQVDPWRYRVRVEELTARADGPLDIAAFVDPGRDDLMVATIGWVAELFGGGPGPAGAVLAVYPVVVAVVMILFAYVIGRWLSGSSWVGLAAAAVLAVTPAHVYRTALGFGDHHAFDYLWLAVTLAGVVYLIRKANTDRERAGAIGVISIALAAQALSWSGSVLLIAPYTAVIGLVLLSTLRADESLVATAGPLVAALWFSSALTAIGVVLLSWQSTEVVIIMLAGAAILTTLLGIGSLGLRLGGSARLVASVLLASAAALAVVVWQYVPELSGTFESGLAYFQKTAGTVAEATSLFGGEDPATTVVSLLGLFGILFIPYLLWYTQRAFRGHRLGWLTVTGYAWYFLMLSGIQRRFVGELSLFFALIVGAGAMDLFRRLPKQVKTIRETYSDRSVKPASDSASWLSDPPALFVATLIVVILLSVAIAQVPLTMNDRTVSDAEYGAAQHIEEYATDQNRTQTDRYVFSALQTNPMYNYYATGSEVSFGYAKRNYFQFIVSDDEEHWYQKLERRGTGFVVITDEVEVSSKRVLQTRLHNRLGSGTETVAGVSHFRAVYRSPDGTVTVYRPVPGGIVAGTAPPNETVTVQTAVSIPNAEFTYRRTTTATANGRYGVLVPYHSTYSVGVGGDKEGKSDPKPVRLTDQGARTRSSQYAAGKSHWPLDEGRGQIFFDIQSGRHGELSGGNWTRGIRGQALMFDGDDPGVVRERFTPDVSDGLTLSLWFRTTTGTDYRGEHPFPRLVAKAPSSHVGNTSGYQISMSKGHVLGGVGDGPGAARLVGPEVDDSQWHHAVLTWNGTVAGLYVNGRLQDKGRFVGDPTNDYPLVFGASADRRHHFIGRLDEVKIYQRSLTGSEIATIYNRTAPNGQ